MLCELRRLFNLHISIVKNTFKWMKTLSSNEIIYIESIKTESNLVRILFYSVLVIFIQISNIVVDATTNAHPQYAIEYLVCCIFLTIVCGLYFFVTLYFSTKYKQHVGLKKKKAVYISFWFIMTAGTLLFCLLDLMERESLINFIVLLASIAIIPVLDGKEFLGVLTFALSGQTIAIIFLGKSAFLLQQCIIITISAAVIAQLLFHSYVSSKILQRRLRLCAETDSLTGLPNRRGLEQWMLKNKSDCIKQPCKIAVGIIDIDDFKEYNDDLGHLEGDECLKYVADCISKSFGKNEGIVSRFGGEEFIVILKDVIEDEAIYIFENIRSFVENNKNDSAWNGMPKNVTISIGVACEQINNGINFNQILKRADNALYKAKRKGKNLVILDNAKIYH